MKAVLVALLFLHGAIHLLGFVKAFRLAAIPQLRQAIPRPLGLLWLGAALALFASGYLLVLSEAHWWMVALPALIASQIAIVASWHDAKAGTIANAILLVPLALALLELRSTSFSSIYRVEVERALAESAGGPIVTGDDLATMPRLVQDHLRRVGVVGRPRPANVRVRWRGEMKPSRDASWMPMHAEQVNTFGRSPTRLFLMDGRLYGIPFQGLHEYIGDSATMRIRAASLLDVVDARGPEMNRSETVTLFNDMCILAPGSLVGAPIEWREIDEHTVGATFTNAGNTIQAELFFDANGDLVDFRSYERDQSADGKTYVRFPWTTPVSDYVDFHGLRLPSRGRAIWHEPSGEFVYGRFQLEDIEVDVHRRPRATPIVPKLSGLVPRPAGAAPM